MRHASMVIVNGAVWRPGGRPATALAVEGEHIVAVGADADIRAMASPGSAILDARGGTILPAFNDAHIHFLMGSRGLSYLDLSGAETQAEVERRISGFDKSTSGPWLLGRGWFYSAFAGGMPSLDLLDRLVPNRPAYMESFDTHCAWVNSRALAVAGIPPGETDGVLREAAMENFERFLPARQAEEDLEALRAGMRIAAEHGIASVQEASRGLRQLDLYETLRNRGELTMRIRLAFDMIPGLAMRDWQRRLEQYREATNAREPNDWIATGILKAFADGVVESKTAALLEPYARMSQGEPGALGAPIWEPGELASAIRIADAQGWQVEVHAIGDAAIRQALDAFEEGNRDRRHRVEHIEAPSAEDIRRFAKLGVVASMQPQHAEPVKNLLEVWAPYLGPERASRGWPWATLVRSGAALAFGTDWPVVPLDVAASLHVAVNRQTLAGRPPGGWLPHERLSIAEAVAAWTSGSAYAEHTEDRKGRLEPGMLADIAVLDRDLATTPAGEIGHIKIEATVVGGRLVYAR